MADNRKISIRLTLEDAEKVRLQLLQMGDDGTKALSRIEQASRASSPGMKALSAATNEVKGNMEGLLSRLGPAGVALGALGPAGLAAGAGIGALIALQVSAIHSFAEMEQATLRLGATLKATGNTTGLGRQELDNYAKSLQNITAIDDKEIVAAEATLATFKNVSGSVFKGVLEQAANLSAVMGGDLAGNVEMLGGVMQRLAGGEAPDLNKAFKFLSDAQKDQIKQLAESNQGYEAQKVLLKDLQETIGGSAAGAASGLTGSFHALSNAWDDFMRSLAASDAVRYATEGLTLFLQAATRGEDYLAHRSPAGGATARHASFFDPNASEASEAAARAALEQRSAEAQNEAGKEYDQMMKDRTEAERESLALAEQQQAARENAIDTVNRQIRSLADEQRQLGETDQARAVDIELTKAQNTYAQAGLSLSDETVAKLKEQATAIYQMKQAHQEAIDKMQEARTFSNQFASTISSSFEDAIFSAKGFGSVLGGLATDIEKLLLRSLILKPLFNSFSGATSGGFGGIFSAASSLFGFADGGRPPVGRPSWVGENGPEIWMPDSAGTIIPNGKLGGSGGASPDITVNVYLTSSNGTDPKAAAQTANQVAAAVKSSLLSILQDQKRTGGVLARGAF